MFRAQIKTIDSTLEGNELATTLADSHRSSRDFLRKNISVIPDREYILEALELISEELELILTVKEFEEILSLFPEVRISLTVYGCSDTQEKELVLDAVFSFVTGCKLPQYKDNVDLERYFEYFHVKAKELGYKSLNLQKN